MTAPSSATSSPTAVVPCAFCSTPNRIDLSKLSLGPKCAQCGRPILLDRPIPGVVRSLRRLVSGMCGGAPVDVTVGDVIVPGVAAGAEQPVPVPR